MTEVIGDVVEPSMFRIPTDETTNVSGAALLIYSGAKIWFHTGTGFEKVTSV